MHNGVYALAYPGGGGKRFMLDPAKKAPQTKPNTEALWYGFPRFPYEHLKISIHDPLSLTTLIIQAPSSLIFSETLQVLQHVASLDI